MGFDKRIKLNLFTWFITLSTVFCSVQPPAINPGIFNTPNTIGECHSCKIFVESFNKGLERTSRGKYEGGDAAWEEEKLKSYKRSELRLVDIQEGICKDESKYAIQCHHVANKAEEFIEEWWAQDPNESEDLYLYICIDSLKVCCPKNHFGKDCKPCLSNLCSGNGKCRGDGTRKGNGTCLCDAGYIGEICDQCALGYFMSYKDDNKILCSECHKACLGGCQGGSQKDCVACKPGFIFDATAGCLDINECEDTKKCKDNQICLNSLGSYTCMDCDKACNGCHGVGPDMCIKCAQDYSLDGEYCVRDSNEMDNSEILASTRNDEL
ncbi:cysteine-rich with EGF-like domain protein 2 isoform X2 [Pararge aegeria]|uniref:Jg20447 protein n=1 Tax=Pararge aegeria aegeria TaxID=348720 RepID=A0A8S4S385_9NEOP|nr:cysteine-rich with EGF-like domain protein 2 isoform X2 [Pararge aegeria]CAH2242451.1 jg20447 [Pararge aegeria aegeria]